MIFVLFRDFRGVGWSVKIWEKSVGKNSGLLAIERGKKKKKSARLLLKLIGGIVTDVDV